MAAIPQNKQEENEIHTARARQYQLPKDLHVFPIPAVIHNYPSLLATCHLLNHLYGQFAILDAQWHHVTSKQFYGAKKKLRRDLAPRILLGLQHVLVSRHTVEVADDDERSEFDAWLFNIVADEIEKIINHEPTGSLLLPFHRRSRPLGDETFAEMQAQAALRGTLKGLDLMIRSAVLPLYKPIPPTTNLVHICQYGDTADSKAKIEKGFWVRRVQKFERGLEDWRLIKRYFEALVEQPNADEERVGMMRRMVDINVVDKHIKQIEKGWMTARMAALEIKQSIQ
ncbi:hypothetical protein LTR70_007840 [Exophiala xenobiotica]|uniref:Uncharacterized protein n=1 Tax=Lithohypha guttulata TaxID=1690604 RepID=A0ABR0JZP1_9EURO|nr:hypothetical protein LTR24_008549 [Lithohypha guttulata]KAK5313000.1 hypothetical protein LTR70_007840 [Exophiala xenobiotica]